MASLIQLNSYIRQIHSGVVAIVFGLMLPVLVGSVGVTVDMAAGLSGEVHDCQMRWMRRHCGSGNRDRKISMYWKIKLMLSLMPIILWKRLVISQMLKSF